MARPREFDENHALEAAMNLFWEKGFSRTSFDDLVKKTGVKKASLYACFGNKEALFKAALNKYMDQGPFDFENEKPVLANLSDFYQCLVDEAKLPKSKRRGCFVFNSCLEFAATSENLGPFVLSLSQKTEDFFYKVISRAKEKNEIPTHIDVKTASQLAFATAFTIREMAKFKPDRYFLSSLANTFFRSLGTSVRLT